MRISITGGMGFIGSALGTFLSGEGHEVRLIDIRDGVVESGISNIQGSMLSTKDCRAACEGADVVIHCAAVHQVSAVADSPLQAIDVNVSGTLNLFRAAIDFGAKRFIYLSSAKVFGEPETLPSAESDFPIPRGTYALSKATGEYQCHMLQARSNMDVVIVRPYSVYGPKQDLNTGYVGMILASLQDGADLHLPGQPDYIRDFVYISDVVRLCSLVLVAPLPGITILNAGSGQSTSLRELVMLAENISGVDLNCQFHAPGPETLIRMQACMKRAKAMLDYRPMIDLNTGLTETIEWFFQNRSAAEKAVG